MHIYQPYSSSFFFFLFLFHGSTAFTEWVLSLETIKVFLKYSYPGLRPFENSVFQGKYKI